MAMAKAEGEKNTASPSRKPSSGRRYSLASIIKTKEQGRKIHEVVTERLIIYYTRNSSLPVSILSKIFPGHFPDLSRTFS